MSEKIKTLNSGGNPYEGDTYVIEPLKSVEPLDTPDDPSIATNPDDPERTWNDFEYFKDDANYVPPKKGESNLTEFEELKRKLDQKIGVGVLSAMSLDEGAA